MSSYENLKKKNEELEEINFQLFEKLNDLTERYNKMCELLDTFDYEKNSKEDTKEFIQWLLYHVSVEMKGKASKKEGKYTIIAIERTYKKDGK